MSSAAKLRKFGRGTAAIAMTATVMTAFGPVAFASWDDAPQTPSIVETSAGNNGTIGVIDTDAKKVDNQGATLVQPGQDNQAIGGVRFTIPNRFVSGDVIELRLLDRSATVNNDGNSNIGPDFKVGLSADPKVDVYGPAAGETLVAGDTDDPAQRGAVGGADAPAGATPAANTETAPQSQWAPSGATGSLTATKPGVTPTFKVERFQSKAGQGHDIVRLTHTGNPSSGDPDAKWVVNLDDLKVDLGSKVTPGALRIVPFAVNRATTGASYQNSDWFFGNAQPNLFVAASDTTAVTTREIGIYTVPAYVAPVVMTVASPNIQSDGSAQSIGDVTIKETHPTSLTNGTYTFRVSGATIVNPQDFANYKVAVAGGGPTEAVRVTGATASTVTLEVTNTDPNTSATFTLSGLTLRNPNGRTGPILYSLTGGSLDQLLTTAGTGGAVGAIPAEADFCASNFGQADTIQPITVPGGAPAADTDFQVASSTGTPLPDGTYTVRAGTYQTVPGFGLFNAAGTPVRGSLATGTTFIDPRTPADTTTFNEAVTDGMSLTIVGNRVTAATRLSTPATTVNVTQAGTTTLGAGTYRVISDGTGVWRIVNAANAVVATSTTNTAPDATVSPTVFRLPGADGGTVTLSAGVPTASTFTVVAGAAGQPVCVNQNDILVPQGGVVFRGSSGAGVSAIGGNNRYETARKIAKLYSPRGDFAIIASGENFPDALSSGFLSQKLKSPIVLTMKNALPEDTMESLRERGVRKVYVIGGEQAVSKSVSDKLASTPAYMWSESARNLVPRGSNLEVIRLGGGSRYTTNQLVNMYAAAQGDYGNQPGSVGQTAVAYGQPLKTTAMIARGDDFADALTANVLTAGRNGGWTVDPTTLTKNLTLNGTQAQIGKAILDRLIPGRYSVVAAADGTRQLVIGGLVVATSTDGTNWTLTEAIAGVGAGAEFSFKLSMGNGAELNVSYGTPGSNATVDFDPLVDSRNALPVILTDKAGLSEAAAAQIENLHIQHALLIGNESALSAKVQSDVQGMGPDQAKVTSRRLAGTDRYDTARVVNEYAMAPLAPTAAKPDDVGLGFDGGKWVSADGTRVMGSEWEAFLANGGVSITRDGREYTDPMKFADALVAGPWVSARRDAMPLVMVKTTPDPTEKFLRDNADKLDRAIGLGLGQAVSTGVIAWANRLVSEGNVSTAAPLSTPLLADK